MADVFVRAGSTVDMDSENTIPVSFREVFGAVPVLTLQARGIPLPGLPDPWLGKTVTWTHGGTLYFTGNCVGVNPHFDQHLGWVITYTCAGLRNRLDWFPHTDQATGLDISAFNLTPNDPLYDLSRAGQNVGQILTTCFLMTGDGSLENLGNVSNLAAYGIGNISGGVLPTITVNDLAALTVIPPRPVYFGGEKLGDAIDSLMSQWAPNYRWWVDPSGNFRFFDLRSLDATRGFPTTTLTMGTDPIEPSELSRDATRCFQRVVLRGQPNAVMALLKQSHGDLKERFGGWSSYADDIQSTGSNAAKAYWIANGAGNLFSNPSTSAGPIQSQGTLSSVSTNSVVYTPTAGLSSWSASFWSNNQGTINFSYSTIAGVTQFWSARITSDGGISGGHATLGFDAPLPNLSFDKATLSGIIPGPGEVFTRYQVQNTYLKGRFTNQSTYPQAFVNPSQTGATLLSSPMGVVIQPNGVSFPLAYTYNNNDTTDPGSAPHHVTIKFIAPTYVVGNNQDVVAGGGDIWIYQPVYTNGLYAVWPPDAAGPAAQYGGTSYDREGLTKTLTVSIDQWIDPAQFGAVGLPSTGPYYTYNHFSTSQPTQMCLYAYDLWTSVADTVVEGEVTYYGFPPDATSPLNCFAFGHSLLIAGKDGSATAYTTGWEGTSFPAGGTTGLKAGTPLGLPIREVMLEWPQLTGQVYITRMRVSNRRDVYSVDQFLKPARRVGYSFGMLEGASNVFGGAVPATEGVSAGIDRQMPSGIAPEASTGMPDLLGQTAVMGGPPAAPAPPPQRSATWFSAESAPKPPAESPQ